MFCNDIITKTERLPTMRKEVVLVVTEIIEKEVLTLRELKKKYATKWFDYVFVDEVDDEPESSLCYVVFVADTEEEIFRHPDPERNMRSGGISFGYSVIFPMEVGGIYVHA